jgi:hypothetical protein
MEAIYLERELLNDLIIQTKNLLLNKNHISPGTLKNYEKDGFRLIRSFFAIHCFTDYSNDLIDNCIQFSREEHQKGSRSLRQFLFFLEDGGVIKLSELTQKNMVSYLSNISERRPVSMGTVVPTIRSFLLYLFNQGIIAHDFNVLLNIKCMKRNTLKPLFTENESERILKNINLTSAQGKRDYAIFMCKCQLKIQPRSHLKTSHSVKKIKHLLNFS